MWVVDREKERARNLLLNDVSGLINRITRQAGEAERITSEFCYTTSGAPSGLGDEMVNDCRRASVQMAEALQELDACKGYVDDLDIMEWVDDDDGL